MRPFGSIIMRHAYSISVQPTWNARAAPGSPDQTHPPQGKLDRERACRGGSRLPSGSRPIDADAGAVLVTGPANAKTELIKHISQHDPVFMKRIVGVETVDHPSDRQLVAHARHYFKADDRMLPQKG